LGVLFVKDYAECEVSLSTCHSSSHLIPIKWFANSVFSPHSLKIQVSCYNPINAGDLYHLD